ncbi:hypothetical protein [Plasmodium yoelii yoelii]|uniref:Uncharacterized protein n=1 Tax=Plasmodium yoelii yoelii TaxID=73239 RepID=Q7RGC7_PLAYO|nr:hypothetical protein [Plasmodium yoelii yoelii]
MYFKKLSIWKYISFYHNFCIMLMLWNPHSGQGYITFVHN